ncbi:MAG: bifunctional ornithine acetyltransferase/N-acetylglutamate synthase, partial [Euryarchaeota archaeon]|nr:bifunctional ornithine acetyltransferase/N-acetylglutamate synthase [Euryarchaeota archaeon]
PNWGRIVAAAGYSGADFDPEVLSLSLRSGGREAVLVEKGKVLAFQGTRELTAAEEVIKGEEVEVVLDLRQGGERATAYSCDMGYDYIRVNAEYTT